MSGYVDVHCHPLPGIDDGARTPEDGAALLAGLAKIGFAHVVATPHVRSGVWHNRSDTVAPARAQLETAMERLRRDGAALPSLDIAAENMLDDVVWEQLSSGGGMRYPSGKAVLVEFPYDTIPVRVEVRLWRLRKQGLMPVLAHPERYVPLFLESDRLEELVGAGARPVLDVMALIGVYGAKPRETAERFLSQGIYAAACTDSHKSADVDNVREAMALLQRTVGNDEFARLFIQGPSRLLEGRDT